VDQPTSLEACEPPPLKSTSGRTPSVRGVQREGSVPFRPMTVRQKSSSTGYNDSSPAMQTESWRTKAVPLPPVPLTPDPATKPPLPKLVAEVEPLTVQEGEDVEVIDFSEFAKFVGAPEPQPEPLSTPIWSDRAPQGERHDLVEARHREPPIPPKSDAVSWRRKAEDGSSILQDNMKPTSNEPTSTAIEEATQAPSMYPRPNVNSSENSHQVVHFSAQRSPRANAFREASMSALDDAMSRIKGALNHMHEIPKEAKKEEVKETTSLPQIAQGPPSTPAPKPEQSKPSRWLPPALRAKDIVLNPFGLGREEPVTVRCPPSPTQVSNECLVRLPTQSRIRGPLTKRQANLSKNIHGAVRWDILSWHPPVEGMTKRELSLNDVLFRRPAFYKGKPRYHVVLPARIRSSEIDSLTPRVNIPNRSIKVSGTGAFGRPRGADETSSWRRSEPASNVDPTPDVGVVLDTVSRSPPPVPHSDLVKASSSPAKVEVQLSAPEFSLISRPRHQPKMPAGSDVAFYRAPLKEKAAVETKTTVSFTVSSELDGGSDHRTSLESPTTEHTVVIGPSSPVPALVQSKTQSKSSDASVSTLI
jgi:serine/arginine repetitive matrix protein 2